MVNIFFKVLFLITFLSTIAICFVKPKMPASVMIYDSQYKIVDEDDDLKTDTIKNIEVKTYKNKVDNLSKQTIKQQTQAITLTETPKKQMVAVTITQNPKVQKRTYTTKQSTQTQTNTLKVEPKKITVSEPTKQEVIQKQTATPVKQEIQTKQQEEISWNIWRSNLQNQIMKDVKLPDIPKGTIFKFSFTVDKYGRITNVRTWSLTSTYTPYAIQYIAPVIRSYQGHSILNFPNNSTRTITNVEGGWKISTSAKYSTPQDYNDKERIEK